MAKLKKSESAGRGMRFKAPEDVHKKIVAHQKLMNIKSDDFISIDDAAIDLLRKGISTVAALNV